MTKYLAPVPGEGLGVRLARLSIGLVLFGAGIGLMLQSGLGVPPWDVLHQGLASKFGLTVGVWSIIVSIAVLLLWLPLGDCPAEMGGLAIARGSHRDGVRDFTVSNGAGAMEVIDPLEGSWVAGPLEAGDVLIFHSLTVHKGLPNRTDRLRISLDNRYQRASEPICERCRVIKRHGKTIVICSNPRHKQRQG